MAFENRPGSGSLFKSEKGKPSNYSGTVKLPDGTDCFIDLYAVTDRASGELKRDKHGQPFYNVRIKPRGGQSAAKADSTARQAPDNFSVDDEIPF